MSTQQNQQLQVGVLGAGPIAQFAHFEALNKARNAELYAICDVAEDLLAQMSAVHGPRHTFTDYAAMLADPELDAVLIATADQYHVAAAREAIAAGKHVLVEKPLGAGPPNACRCETRCARAGSCCRSARCGASIPASPSRATSSATRSAS